MQIYRPRLTHLNEKEVLRYAGQRDHQKMILGDLKKACRGALLLAQPQCTWNIYDYDEDNFSILTPTGSFPLSSEILRNHLQGCHQIVVLAVTIGAQLEDQVDANFSSGQYTQALLLDAAGSTAVEATANQVNQAINAQLSKLGFFTLARFSPGYGDWDLAIQSELLPLTGGAAIGMTVTESSMLVPRKSITAVIGVHPEWLRNFPKDSLNDAIQCNLSNCLARRSSKV